MAQHVPHKRGFGCLGYGCIIAVVLIALTIGGIFWLARSAMRSAIQRFTTEQAAPVPTVTFDEAARASFGSKVEECKRVINDPRASGECTFSQSDVLGAFGETPFNGKVFVELQGDAVSATFSFPLNALGEWDSAKPIIGDYLNRYVTGSARAKVSVTEGSTAVTFESLILNGQVFDGDALKEANEWVSGFINSQASSPEAQKARARIESARIENGSVIVRIRPE